MSIFPTIRRYGSSLCPVPTLFLLAAAGCGDDPLPAGYSLTGPNAPQPTGHGPVHTAITDVAYPSQVALGERIEVQWTVEDPVQLSRTYVVWGQTSGAPSQATVGADESGAPRYRDHFEAPPAEGVVYFVVRAEDVGGRHQSPEFAIQVGGSTPEQ